MKSEVDTTIWNKTIGSAIELVGPWPVPKRWKMHEWEFVEGTATLHAECDGTITVELKPVDGPPTVQKSISLYFHCPTMVLLLVTWRGDQVTIRVNGEDVGEGGDLSFIGFPQSTWTEVDDSKGRSNALAQRRHYKRSHPPSERTSIATSLFSHLSEEFDCLNDQIGLVDAGRFHNVRAVANIVRKLVCSGQGQRILQNCAAFCDQPLIVFTTPYGGGPPKLSIPFAVFVLSPPGLELGPGRSVKTDLDCWLERTEIELDGKQGTNESLIKSIGDKIGAHADLDLRGAVRSLQASRHADEVSTLVYYIMQWAGLVSHLSARILNAGVAKGFIPPRA